MFCTKCGSELPEGVSHCVVCGAAVRHLPPLRPDQDVPAGRTPPAPSASAPFGAASPEAGPAYAADPAQNAPASQNGPAYRSGPAYQTPPPQNAPAYRSGPAYQTPPTVPPMRQSGPAYPAYHHNPVTDNPADTVGMGEWLWSSLVMLLPMVNFVLLCVWAFGVGAKPSKRNWARAMLILIVVWIAFAFALVEFLDQIPI